ncbi:hypothetical protein L596_016841 [Steinernema carpocapsae]|uniref:Uncharacterized protein n=1 Tax=Steinernema carpocapsae TaxID=34508 RepID=A0A4U5NK85_STECR|nr:hypothetical protein L596_016841 [Steinernema carpocapsae]
MTFSANCRSVDSSRSSIHVRTPRQLAFKNAKHLRVYANRRADPSALLASPKRKKANIKKDAALQHFVETFDPPPTSSIRSSSSVTEEATFATPPSQPNKLTHRSIVIYFS